jgi:RHS repeat-associated protein
MSHLLTRFEFSFLKSIIATFVAVWLVTSIEIKAQTSYSASPPSTCGSYSTVYGTGLKVNASISGNTLNVTVFKMINSSCSLGNFSSGTMELRTGSATGTVVRSVTYGATSTVNLSYTLSFTSGTTNFYITATGLPGYSVGPIAVAATTLNAPILSSPASGVTLSSPQNITFSWNKNNTTSASYVLKIRNLTTDIVVFETSQGDVSSVTLSPSQYNGQYGHSYRWVVYAQKSGFANQESGSYTFSIQNATPNISIQYPLPTSPLVVNVNQSVNAEFALRNTGNGPGTVSDMTVAVLKNGSLFADFPFVYATTIGAGQSATYSQNYTFNTAGTYQLEARWKINGYWYDDQNNRRTITVSYPALSITSASPVSPNIGLVNSTSFNFGTSVSGGSGNYEAWVVFRTPDGGTNEVPVSMNRSGNSFSLSRNLQEAGLYSYKYRVRDTSTGITTESSWSFGSIETLFPRPLISTPSNGAAISNINLRTDWNDVANADRYRVQFSNSSTGWSATGTNAFATVIKDFPAQGSGVTLTQSEFTWTEAQAGQNYCVSARAGNVNGRGEWSSPVCFTTLSPDPSISVNTPSTGITGQYFGLSWASTQQTAYQIELFKAGTSIATLVPKTTSSAQSYSWAIPSKTIGNDHWLYGVDYQIRVTVWNASNVAKVANSGNFKITPQTSCTGITDINALEGEQAVAVIDLINKGIVQCPINGLTYPELDIIRQDFAKLLFAALLGTSATPVDGYVSSFTDLPSGETGRYIKALSYLEYQDGISVFTRDLSTFNPTLSISRDVAIKAFAETWNQKPTTGTNPFVDTASSSYLNYIIKAYQLQWIKGSNSNFYPNETLKRKDAFVILYRMLTNGVVGKPTPTSADYATISTSNLEIAGAMGISPSPLVKGQAWNYSVQVRNTGNTAWAGKVRLALLDASGAPMDIIQETGNGWDTVNLAGGQLLTLSFSKTTITNSAGNYKFRLEYQKTGITGFVSVPAATFTNPVNVTIQEATSNCVTIDNDPLFANGANATWKEAALFLVQRSVVECPASGSTIQANQSIVRQDLAKILYIALWGSPTTASVTDNFPSPYTDLQNTSTGYHRYAKALLYLEYGDGVSPFTRNRTHFYPVAKIPRQFALKVLLEGWRIAPSASVSTPPFSDVPLSTEMVRYIDKAKALGFVQGNNGTFEPNANLMRGDAFIILKRMIEGTTTTPKPALTDLNNTANFFVPDNVTPQTMHSAPDLSQGNFNHYAKSAFSIADIGFGLSFNMEYNSYLTDMPDEWTVFGPLSKGWTHNYMALIYQSLGGETVSNTEDRYVVNLGGTSLNSYRTDTLLPETEGVYDQLAINGNMATLTMPTREVYTFQRMDGDTNPFWLTSIKDRNNNTLTLNYGAPYTKSVGGRTISLRAITEVVVPSGRKLTFTYQNNKLVSVKDPINRQVNIGYNTATGQLETFTDAKSNVTTYGYGQGLEIYLLKSVRLPEGNVITTEYDLNRKAKSITSNGETTTINLQPQYNDPTAFLKSTVTEKVDGKTTTYTAEYLKNNSLKNYAGPNGHNVGLTYNYATDKTLPTTITDSRMGTTTFGYNTKGNPTSSSWNGLSSVIVYQDDVFPKEITDPNGFKTILAYNAQMNPETITDPEGGITRTAYFPNGLPQSMTNPAGIQTTFTYNQYGNIETTNMPEGISTRMDYDGVSRPFRFTNPLGQITTTSYDLNDNVESEVFGGATTQYGFDKNDNLRWIKDALLQTTSFTYDALDRLKDQSFNGKSRTWTYLDGVMKTYTNPNGKTFTYTYDSEGRTENDGYAAYTYNTDGTLASVSKDGKSVSIGYDTKKRPSSSTYQGQTVSYEYDNNGNVVSMTYPGNKKVVYTYDRNNRLKTVTDWNNKVTRYDYYADGRIQAETLPNGIVTTYTYDAAGRNTGMNISKSGSAAIASYTFVLDKLGQHQSVTATEPLGIEPPLNNQTQTAIHINNLLTTLNGATVTHSNNGAITQGNGYQISYDDHDMPLSISGNGLNTQYTYDGLGIRRSRIDNGVVTQYILDILGMEDVLMETDANFAPKAYYVYGLGLISRIKPDGTTHYYHGDFRGSVVAMTDVNGTITHKYQYGPFGEVAQRQEPANDSQPFLYVGKQGLMYEGGGIYFVRARYYDAQVGRFLSEDAVWHTNLYSYADNNPIVKSDTDGNFWHIIGGAAIGCGWEVASDAFSNGWKGWGNAGKKCGKGAIKGAANSLGPFAGAITNAVFTIYDNRDKSMGDITKAVLKEQILDYVGGKVAKKIVNSSVVNKGLNSFNKQASKVSRLFISSKNMQNLKWAKNGTIKMSSKEAIYMKKMMKKGLGQLIEGSISNF